MAGPPDAPDFHDRPLFGPGFGGLPPIGLPGFPRSSDFWRKKLGLNKDQSSKVDNLLKKQMGDLNRLHQQMWKDRETLQAKFKATVSDDEIEKLLNSLSQDRKDFMTTMDQFDNQIRSILTPRQRAQIMLGLDQDVWTKPQKGHGGWNIRVFDNGEGVTVERHAVIPDQGPSSLEPDFQPPTETPSSASTPGLNPQK
jgi:Spy/CpxP family protein refolding chaperone